MRLCQNAQQCLGSRNTLCTSSRSHLDVMRPVLPSCISTVVHDLYMDVYIHVCEETDTHTCVMIAVMTPCLLQFIACKSWPDTAVLKVADLGSCQAGGSATWQRRGGLLRRQLQSRARARLEPAASPSRPPSQLWAWARLAGALCRRWWPLSRSGG